MDVPYVTENSAYFNRNFESYFNKYAIQLDKIHFFTNGKVLPCSKILGTTQEVNFLFISLVASKALVYFFLIIKRCFEFIFWSILV